MFVVFFFLAALGRDTLLIYVRNAHLMDHRPNLINCIADPDQVFNLVLWLSGVLCVADIRLIIGSYV